MNSKFRSYTEQLHSVYIYLEWPGVLERSFSWRILEGLESHVAQCILG